MIVTTAYATLALIVLGIMIWLWATAETPDDRPPVAAMFLVPIFWPGALAYLIYVIATLSLGDRR